MKISRSISRIRGLYCTDGSGTILVIIRDQMMMIMMMKTLSNFVAAKAQERNGKFQLYTLPNYIT
jgi:hypothetical protein